jgi:ATP-dependent RNA helicase RhlE
MTAFADLSLLDDLKRAVGAQGYDRPTPIQAQAIPPLLEGRDLLGCAQTGTGKTAAFALPILQRLMERRVSLSRRACRVLVLAPTRELAAQINESFRTYGKHLPLRHAVIFGGVGQGPQVQKLAGGVDVLVATPGRLLDLMSQGHLRLDQVEVFVLDEADRMLDMGFIHDVRKVIAKLPAKRQTLLFSATMPREIEMLAERILHEPVRVAVTPVSSTVERIDQRVYFVDRGDKRALLVDLLRDDAMSRVLVFARTKRGADRVARDLAQARVSAEAIHGNKSQSARQQALAGFKDGRTRVLVATDIAARGIDINGVSHVVNYDLPYEPEAYVHRIGRTARAGRDGSAIAFCDADERPLLRQIEKLTRQPIEVVTGHRLEAAAAPLARPVASTTPTARPGAQPHRQPGRPPRRGGRGSGGRRRAGGGRHAAA